MSSKSQWRILIIFFFIVLASQSILAQKQTNNWYFGVFAGLDFNNGQPTVIPGPYQAMATSACMSDSNGNFLFATRGDRIINKLMGTMENGDDIMGNRGASQGAFIVQKPSSDHLYYVFTTGILQGTYSLFGLYYSVVDMNLDGGLGAVTSEKNILLNDAWDALDKIVGVKHKNGEDIWVITWKYYEPGYAAFLVTSAGINTKAVFSPGIEKSELGHLSGNMKVSHDKKHLVAAFKGDFLDLHRPDFEICSFNAETGAVDLLYLLRFSSTQGHFDEPWGVEFSPDSKYLYLSTYGGGVDDEIKIHQLDMQYYADSVMFFDTKIKIAEDVPGLGLQLATDGKIYLTGDNYGPYEYVSIIHKPWEKGTACAYEADAIFLDFDNQGRQVGNFLPNILVDHLFRFEWEGRCSSQPFVFSPNFQPGPEYIRWSFSDPGSGADSISFDLNPTHYFSHAGEFEVKVTVRYPNFRIEKTSRVVSVDPSPHPDLGPDTLKCENGEISLNSNETGMHVWSTGDMGMNVNEITVSNTGWYWVRVSNDIGCPTTDSIFVGLYPNSIIDETNLNLVPTSCGGSSGKILGLTADGTQPLTYEWFDGGGNLIGSTLDIEMLSVGNYFLHIHDGNGCTTISSAYTIIDAGDIVITQVDKENAHCGLNIASLTITAEPTPNDLLYSIDDGSTWQDGNPIFNMLAAGSYFIRAKDASGCEGAYANNPIIIEDIAGPQLTSSSTTPETDNLSDGEIDIVATVSSGQAFYSIDNGNSWQVDDGLFTNLTAGVYSCIVKDDFECDTIFDLEVERVISQLIEARAGNGNTCMGNVAVVPLILDNFTDIFSFHVKLTYDSTLLICDSYINMHPSLEANMQASIIPGTDEIIVSWQGTEPITLDEGATMLELVFEPKAEGMADIDWVTQLGESAFFNQQLEEISCSYLFGSLRVYAQPQIMMPTSEQLCSGDTLIIFPFVNGGSGDNSFLWEGPNGFSTNDQMLVFMGMTTDQSGIYNLRVSDTIGCVAEGDMQITVTENPQIAFAANDTIFGEKGFFLDAGQGYEDYLWNTGETTNSIQINSEDLYSVLVTSVEGCESSAAVMVFWGGVPFSLPNAFTPNGDGLNDVFIPIRRYDFVKQYHLSIYNRWGQIVFETDNIDEGWDGTSLGKAAPKGNYVYNIIYTSYPDLDTEKNYKGQVVLLR